MKIIGTKITVHVKNVTHCGGGLKSQGVWPGTDICNILQLSINYARFVHLPITSENNIKKEIYFEYKCITML